MILAPAGACGVPGSRVTPRSPVIEKAPSPSIEPGRRENVPSGIAPPLPGLVSRLKLVLWSSAMPPTVIAACELTI